MITVLQVFANLCTDCDTNPGLPNKLLPLKVDCFTHNEPGEHSETHQASRNPIRTKTNIWSCKLSLHHHPSLQTHTSVWNTSWWLNKQIPTFLVFGFWGARLVIISLSCYSMSGPGGGGVGWGFMDERGRGVGGAFAENIIGMAPVTLSVRLCCASLCAFAGPLRCFIKQGAGPLRRCLCSLCGSTTQRGARLAIAARRNYN